MEKKMKQTVATRKLLVGEIVEVRSMNKDLLGSWYVGIVTGDEEHIRHVKFDDIMNDDGSKGLEQAVKVSPILDGHVSTNTSTYCRGNIRPRPPSIGMHNLSLEYGLCVDVHAFEAWWEAVIFDNEVGSDERRVFLPDLGNELKATKDTLRITQDWDEVTGEWKTRGNWAFVELLEESKQTQRDINVPAEQIWCEIQNKLKVEKNFKDWTYPSRDFWKKLLQKVLCSSFNIEVDTAANSKRGGKSIRSDKKLKSKCESSGERSTRVVGKGDSSASKVRSHQTDRPNLSQLIDRKIVLEGAKVHYRNKIDGNSSKEGRIRREGIECSCCRKIFKLTKFEAHAGSTRHRPAEHTFLEDGRSIQDCYRPLDRDPGDEICSVCHSHGDLLLCDQCPSAFHIKCLGLKDIPKGDWFCPSCCCGICGIGKHTHVSSLLCGQCEHLFHIECLRNKSLISPDYKPEGIWFCNRRCEQIHLGLQNLLGKSIPVEGHDNLAWTLLKHKGGEVNETEINKKLKDALKIMSMCFEPMKEQYTRRDLVKDLIFGKRSKLHRLNFQGFYTMALESNGELATVATIRIHGEKVAEMPLVATRLEHRKFGMCRILMNELQKKLAELGVERLVLPSVSNMLKTWKNSFGFSEMESSERLNFLGCAFLNFPGAIMCQKSLKNISATEMNQSPGTRTGTKELPGNTRSDGYICYRRRRLDK